MAELLRYAGTELDATDVFTGVSQGNERSIALLRRLGFDLVADFDTYSRYHLVLKTDETTPK